MTKKLLTLILLFTALTLTSKNVIIQNPAYELKTSGIENVTRIKITKNEMRLHVHITFAPNHWVSFSKNSFIQDTETGKKFYASRMENGEFDKQIYMPASGDSAFVLVFPKLDKLVKKINYGEGDETSIYGISLDPKVKQQPKPKTVPAEVQTWMEQEISKAKRQMNIDLESKDFFSPDSIRIVGYIKGYDPRVEFTTGIVYNKNELTNENSPTIVQIHPDGRFETTLSANYPIRRLIAFNRTYIDFYAEPGQALAIVLDWEDFLRNDRFRNRRYSFEYTQFIGPTAQINQELASAQRKLNELPLPQVYQAMDEKSPEDFVEYVKPFAEQIRTQTEQLCAGEGWTQTTQTILRNDYKIQHAGWLLDYDMSNDRRAEGQKPYVLPDDYFDFLRNLPLNSQSILTASTFSLFINRFEFCSPLASAQNQVYKQMMPQKSYYQYLFEELNLPKTEEDKLYLSALDSLNIKLNLPNMTEEKKKEVSGNYHQLYAEFNERYKIHYDKYKKKYLDTVREMTRGEIKMETLTLQDSIARQLSIGSSLIYDITKVRNLDFMFKNGSKDEMREYLNQLEKGIINTYLVNEAERLYAKNYPDAPKVAYDLPSGKAADTFRKIIEPHKGKFLFVDFWGTSCGPCIHGIRSMKTTREKYKESEDIQFIFITSESESPKNVYDKFVEQQGLKITHRLNSDDYLYLRELFKFNGIPRYILVDKEGRIMDDNFQMYLFENKLPEILEKK